VDFFETVGYPQCPHPELVRGLREHTDAGGIFLLLQDEQVSGLEFFKDGQWVQIPPSKDNTIFINTGDQVEVLSNGRYKSGLHRVMADKNGSRLSIATLYNSVTEVLSCLQGTTAVHCSLIHILCCFERYPL